MENLKATLLFTQLRRVKIAGTPFLYLSPTNPIDTKTLNRAIEKAAVIAMKGKRLHYELVFVRQDENVLVFRSRFYVPQEKMFCCGNLCHNCIRFRL